jgi:predicted DNA-binding transcriptional regulator AlpA
MGTGNWRTKRKASMLSDAAAVDDKVVAVVCSCKVSTVWDRVKNGTFLQPIRIGGLTRRNVGQLRAFLATGELNRTGNVGDFGSWL